MWLPEAVAGTASDDEDAFRFLEAASSSAGKLMREKTLAFCFLSAAKEEGFGIAGAAGGSEVGLEEDSKRG